MYLCVQDSDGLTDSVAGLSDSCAGLLDSRGLLEGGLHDVPDVQFADEDSSSEDDQNKAKVWKTTVFFARETLRFPPVNQSIKKSCGLANPDLKRLDPVRISESTI